MLLIYLLKNVNLLESNTSRFSNHSTFNKIRELQLKKIQEEEILEF